jgi:hypothetical protein
LASLDVWRTKVVKTPTVDGSGSAPGPWGGVRAYFATLWSGTEPLHRVIISDMLIGGTLVNVVAMGATFALFALEAPRWLGVAVFLSSIPYSLFLALAVWRTAGHASSSWMWPARALALLWLGAMVFI